MNGFDALLLGASICAGAVAAMTGFGIGSILTPIMAWQSGMKLAVVVVAVPHFIATLIRFWLIRREVNRKVLITFGVASAAGGLAGALLHDRLHGAVLTVLFGALLLIAGVMGMTALSQRLRFRGAIAGGAGALSGLFGGMVGNQGGIRSAALMAFDLSKEALVATATAVGLIVDIVRLPVYLFSEFRQILAYWPALLAETAGVIIGTFLGTRLLRHVPEAIFRRVLGGLIFLLGAYMLWRGAQPPQLD